MTEQFPNFELIKSEEDITRLLLVDEWRMNVLHAAQELNLPDWWIGAGFLRNAVWNAIEGKVASVTRDVDLVYFDALNVDPEYDWSIDEEMKKKYPFADWEVRNQSRMHYVNNFPPFTSTEDGIAHWVETATCVAVKLEDDELKYLFCHGTEDLFGLIARPTPEFKAPSKINIFENRVAKKEWRTKWPHLKVETE